MQLSIAHHLLSKRYVFGAVSLASTKRSRPVCVRQAQDSMQPNRLNDELCSRQVKSEAILIQMVVAYQPLKKRNAFGAVS